MDTPPVILKARLHYGPPLFGYVLALSLVSVSGVGRIALMTNGLNGVPFLLFYPAIALASFLGGVGPGLLAVVAGAAFGVLFFPVMPIPFSWIALSVIGPLLVTGFAHLRELSEESSKTALECERFRFISDQASDWMFLSSENGEIEYANRVACRQLGLDPEKLKGIHLEEMVAHAQREALRAMLATCNTKNPAMAEFLFIRFDGMLVPAEVKCTAVKSQGGIVLHVVARDITERREMEGRLREAQKWESLGVMAGGLAHDFNNLLTSILGNTSLARDILSEPGFRASLVSGHLAEVERAGERSAELVRLMLATAGRRSGDPEILPINRILERALARRSVPDHIRVLTEVSSPAHPANNFVMSSSVGTTVIGSLIDNAAEAYGQTPGDVRIRICAGKAPALGTGSFEEGAPCDDCVGIIVEDQGCGMTKDVLQRAFDPFFSTKFTGRGMGLPAVRGLVRAHAGKLWIRTEPGKGTRVEVWLPQIKLGSDQTGL